MKLKLLVYFFFFISFGYTKPQLLSYKQFDKTLLKDTQEDKSDSTTICSEVTLRPRTSAEKLTTIAFYTIVGGVILGGLTMYIHQGDFKDPGYGGIIYGLAGLAEGFTLGILVVSFDLDRHFRRKHNKRYKKKKE